MKSVYKIPQKIKCLTDERKRKSIPLFNIVMPVLLFLMLQYESFHTIFSAPESMSKRLKNCLSRKKHTGETEYFYRSVVCMIIGKSPHVILGQEMLKPRDGAEKDEGELTGAKRLIRRLKKRHGHFADVIVADALYLNAPFINTLKECGLETVIRLKDERRLLFQDAESMFQRDEGRKRSFRKGKKSIEVWDLSGFEIDLTWTIS